MTPRSTLPWLPFFATIGAACGPAPVPPSEPTPTGVVQVETTPPNPPAATNAVIAEAPIAPVTDFAALRQAPPPPRQTQTPPVTKTDLGVAIRPRWSARVGTTTFRTTMAHVGTQIVIGTHGTSLSTANEASDAIYLLDAATGRIEHRHPVVGPGDRDVGGIAIDGDRIVYGTDHGRVVAIGFDGAIRWTATLKGKVRPAPALGDVNGDGTLDVIVGDESGQLAALDGSTGRSLWSETSGENAYGNKGYLGAAALVDVDGDGVLDVVSGGRDGVLTARRGRDGKVLWQAKHSSGIHASPSVVDFDGDGRDEILAAWSYGQLTVLDAATGEELWGQRLELDGAGIEGLFASPVPLPGAPGVIVQGTAWWDDRDGLIGVGAFERAFKSFEGRVTSSAVVTDLDDDGTLEAIVGTEKGKVVAIRPDGAYQVLTQVPGGVEATPMIADVDADGTFELLVASRDGQLRCFETGSRSHPFLSRFRGDDLHNTGRIAAARLGWKATGPLPKTLPEHSGGAVRIDYLECCKALQNEATRRPTPENRRFLEASAECARAAARGADAGKAKALVRRTLAGASPPSACR